VKANIDATTQAKRNQRISEFADTDILPTLRDHWVIRERGLVADEPIFGPGVVVERCPTPGRIKADISFDWKATRGDLTGIALVTYVEDDAGEWSILHGADPETGELDSGRILPMVGNSKAITNPEDQRLTFDRPLPAGIDAGRTTTFFVTTGVQRPTTAPLQPSPEAIEGAEILGRVHACR